MTSVNPADQFAGAITLLRDCVGGQTGQRLLIVSEPEGSNLYDDDAPRMTAMAGRTLGMHVYQTQSQAFLASAEDKNSLMDSLRGFDHIVFFSRVGDQIRFSNDEDMPSSTMCYTLDLESMNSEFGTACYFGMCDVKNAIDTAFVTAEHVSITCPLGTRYQGFPQWQDDDIRDVAIKRFPMLISKPIPALGMSGKVMLSRFLVATGSQVYDPFHLPLTSDICAHVQNNSIDHFEGKPDEVRRVQQHYEQVSQEFDIDPNFVHSWHAGIHPGCQFRQHAESNIQRWSTTAFGNPRLLHFHTCGNYAPGEISWTILDPTIRINDVAIWENGCLYPQRIRGSDEFMENHPQLAGLYQHPNRDVGLAN